MHFESQYLQVKLKPADHHRATQGAQSDPVICQRKDIAALLVERSASKVCLINIAQCYNHIRAHQLGPTCYILYSSGWAGR
jgi:hypothetical protein